MVSKIYRYSPAVTTDSLREPLDLIADLVDALEASNGREEKLIATIDSTPTESDVLNRIADRVRLARVMRMSENSADWWAGMDCAEQLIRATVQTKEIPS